MTSYTKTLGSFVVYYLSGHEGFTSSTVGDPKRASLNRALNRSVRSFPTRAAPARWKFPKMGSPKPTALDYDPYDRDSQKGPSMFGNPHMLLFQGYVTSRSWAPPIVPRRSYGPLVWAPNSESLYQAHCNSITQPPSKKGAHSSDPFQQAKGPCWGPIGNPSEIAILRLLGCSGDLVSRPIIGGLGGLRIQ